MIIVRYVGYAVASCAMLLLGLEIIRYLETSAVRLITLRQLWRGYDAESLDRLYKTVSESYFPGLWNDLVETLISLPMLSVAAILSAFLLFISRHSD